MINLAVVIPCYNEEEVLHNTCHRVIGVLRRLEKAGKIAGGSRIYLVDDGSKDRTWSIIETFSQSGMPVVGIKLSCNRGHQNALLAGLFTAQGDAVVTIDADLQDDLEVIEEMVDHNRRGSDIVYGVRRTRDKDSFFKRFTAESFYRLMSCMGARTLMNHADYRLMSRRAIEALSQYKEVNLFLRGMVPLIGLPSSIVYYERAPRAAGESKYPLKRMCALALDGITSFSVVPLRIISLIGFLVFLLTLVMSAWILWVKMFTDQAIPGWASVLLPVYFLGGIQLLCLGVIGEYVGKLYAESKGRPRYIIEKISPEVGMPARLEQIVPLVVHADDTLPEGVVSAR